MSTWPKILAEITQIIDGSDSLYFRGHSDSSWNLAPGLARLGVANPDSMEETITFDFVTRAGSLLPEGSSSWNTAFSMQHHGLPTRLLDWTESFPVALYFALKNANKECCIWILDPFELNRQELKRQQIIHPDELSDSYTKCFEKHSPNKWRVAAISPLRHHPRIYQQRSAFTVHRNIMSSLESIHPKILKKIVIPKKLQDEARLFLKVIGISEFTLFPDLDGLAREINEEYFGPTS